MENSLIKTKEIGNHRIKIYYDSCTDSPCIDWSMAAIYLFEYNDRYHHRLHRECNWREVWGELGNSNHSLSDSMSVLIQENCDFDKLFGYIRNGKLDGIRLQYDKSGRIWRLEGYSTWIFDGEPKWHEINNFTADERKCKYWDSVFGGLLDLIDVKMFVEIINNCSDKAYAKEWGTIGYSQGDHVSGIAFCTKERFIKRVGKDTSDWKMRIDELIDDEVKCIGMWMWGDVKGFVLEEKVEFTKTFKDGRESEEDFEWRRVDDCWGYYMETEELIDEVISMHNLKEEEAA